MSRKLNPNYKKKPDPVAGIIKVLTGLALIPVILIIVVISSMQYYKSSYRNEQKLLAKELSDIKTIPDEEIRLEAAKSAKLEYPVSPPLKTAAQIAGEAKDIARKLTGEKFNQKTIAAQVDDAIKSFKEAGIGQQVEFMTKTRKGAVKGIYRGKDGIFVVVDTEKYSMRDIFDEFRYLFDSDLATFKTQEKIKAIKGGFKAESDKYLEENRKRIEDELYLSSGYVKSENGTWLAKSDVFEKSYTALKQQKDNSRRDEMQKAVLRHKLFGFISVEPEMNK